MNHNLTNNKPKILKFLEMLDKTIRDNLPKFQVPNFSTNNFISDRASAINS